MKTCISVWLFFSSVFFAEFSALGQKSNFLSAATAALPDTGPLAPGQGGVGNWDGVINAAIEGSTAARSQHWRRDFSSAENYSRSIETNRARFAHIIGVRDPRVAFEAPSLMATVDQPALVGRGKSYDVQRVSWPAFGDVRAEGLLLEPRGRKPVAAVVAVPDCAQTPEQISGLTPGVAVESQFARRLAQQHGQSVEQLQTAAGDIN